MKKSYWLAISLFVVTILLASCQSNDQELKVVTDERSEMASEFVTDYKEKMVDAFDSGNFNALEPYLITNNSFYHSLRRYITDAPGEGQSKELLSFEVDTVYENESGELFVDTAEKVLLTERGVSQEIERDVRFELTRYDEGSIKIITIRNMSEKKE
ncbi:TcaA NTF2-like domain-containing protein [Bacillus sp. FJAT-45037]|uniref:TcaA NTF2-like domain-containing protein n=1 Tax=Bacillus sp. FJAT-45037 TaxID=2011007 RepID=UPI000C24FE8A|nr:hypothetical protein [Bacillus sp. FJAT-45037]